MTDVIAFLLIFLSLPYFAFCIILMLVMADRQKRRHTALEEEVKALRARLDQMDSQATVQAPKYASAPSEKTAQEQPLEEESTSPISSPSTPKQPRPQPAKPSRSNPPLGEGFIGKVLISVAAASLVFIALILLALDQGTKIPDEVRILSIFLLSGLILGESVNKNGKSREKMNKTQQNEVIPLDSDVDPYLYTVASNLEGRCTGSKESYG